MDGFKGMVGIPFVTSMLQKFRRLQIRGVQGEVVYAYREPWTTKEMRPPKLSRRVKIEYNFSKIHISPQVTFGTDLKIFTTIVIINKL